MVPKEVQGTQPGSSSLVSRDSSTTWRCPSGSRGGRRHGVGGRAVGEPGRGYLDLAPLGIQSSARIARMRAIGNVAPLTFCGEAIMARWQSARVALLGVSAMVVLSGCASLGTSTGAASSRMLEARSAPSPFPISLPDHAVNDHRHERAA
jgi:hypothetical protein